MKKLVVAMMLCSGGAFAHPSLLPHEHPHGASLLPDLASIAIATLVLVGLWLVARRFSRE